jgi:cobalamin biosynthesis protein CobT
MGKEIHRGIELRAKGKEAPGCTEAVLLDYDLYPKPEDADKDGEGGSGEGDDDEEPLTKKQQAVADDEAEQAMQEIEQDASKTISEQALEVIVDKSTTTLDVYKPTPTAVVSEMDVSDAEYIAKLAAEGVALLGSDGAKMTRHLVANSRPRTVRNRDYGRLDIRAVASDEMDVRKDLYNQRKPGALCPAAVSILIDGSGSMSHNGAVKSQYSSLVAHGVAHYLDKARVPFEVAYFDSICSATESNSEPQYMVVKAWAEPWHGKAITRAREFSRGGTPLASTMTMQAQRLLERPEDKKVAIVLTDGEPCGTGEHISRSVAVVKALREMGVVVIGIGINVDVSQIFGDGAVCLPPENIGAEMVRRLTEILDSHRSEKSATVTRR